MSGPSFRTTDPVDFLVLGAGAAGGVVAKELSTAGFQVVVLEQGPYLREKDYSHDEIKYSFRPGLTNDPKVQPILYRKSEGEQARLLKAIEYGRQVGGGTVHFTANYWRFHESDFHERSLFGDVSGAALADWPIGYADLEPYYTQAEHDLGISGLAGANPFEAPRSKPYPLPPMPVKSSGVLFERAAKKLGLHPFPAPVAILSQPYGGRAACAHCGFCESFGCEMRANQAPWSVSFLWPKRPADAKFDRTLTSAKSRRTTLAALPEPFTSTGNAVRFSSAPKPSSSAPTAQKLQSSC